jgi:ribonuclease HI
MSCRLILTSSCGWGTAERSAAPPCPLGALKGRSPGGLFKQKSPAYRCERSAGMRASPERPTQIFVDGSCLGNPGPGGWAVAFGTDDDDMQAGPWGTTRSGSAPSTTNNRMELTAALEALRAAEGAGARPGGILIVTDSQYVSRGAQEWLPGWKARGWRTSAGRMVANQDLWEELEERMQRWRPSWTWIRGHAGLSPTHDRADALARARARQQAEVERAGAAVTAPCPNRGRCKGPPRAT